MATSSILGLPKPALKTILPMRPKPFIATFKAILSLLKFSVTRKNMNDPKI